MSVFCDRPMTDIVNLMDITDRSGAPFTARSAVIQRRKKLGEGAVRELLISRSNTGTSRCHTRNGTDCTCLRWMVWSGERLTRGRTAKRSANTATSTAKATIRRCAWSV
ncbi:hypothetical protein CKK19_04505 [Enterobacter sp. CCUG 70166]|nr:hypothetical protein [Enterobacter sp. CCUG 70166]